MQVAGSGNWPILTRSKESTSPALSTFRLEAKTRLGMRSKVGRGARSSSTTSARNRKYPRSSWKNKTSPQKYCTFRSDEKAAQNISSVHSSFNSATCSKRQTHNPGFRPEPVPAANRPQLAAAKAHRLDLTSSFSLKHTVRWVALRTR